MTLVISRVTPPYPPHRGAPTGPSLTCISALTEMPDCWAAGWTSSSRRSWWHVLDQQQLAAPYPNVEDDEVEGGRPEEEEEWLQPEVRGAAHAPIHCSYPLHAVSAIMVDTCTGGSHTPWEPRPPATLFGSSVDSRCVRPQNGGVQAGGQGLGSGCVNFISLSHFSLCAGRRGYTATVTICHFPDTHVVFNVREVFVL
jgi:hypothetical protein